ncbi:plastocyanin [Natrinema sp. CBA1119]|uniref:plastocyanin/azurin family copper-binding protein n=1 Tax=Natrinema sp. CBA1119 TaxID=1608465 RepID=UPI000BF3D587|nr:plastocyanin/azurin family copper-binding protein [Natrinema sp. CBA1119]PGF17012.1 plastocyanin [Natrinema sp. CBA1119]
MTKLDGETPEESFDNLSDTVARFERRPVLKALSAGAVVSLGSGITAASGDDDQDGGDQPSQQIDPQFGYSTADAANIPDGLAPDHEVELHTNEPADPQNPSRPLFFHFEPSGIHVDAGDIVQFTLVSPDHSITAYHHGMGFQQRVPDGVPPFSSPVLNVGGAWLYEFTESGVYDVYCGPHHILGMDMRIVVGDLTEEDLPDYVETFEGSEDPPLLPPFSKEFLEHELNAPSDENEGCEWTWVTPQEILGADSLDPLSIQDRGAVPFTDVLADIDRFADVTLEHGDAGEADEDAEATATVQVRDHAEYGEILVGPDEMTLYMFVPDAEAGGESTCYGNCAVTWPPLTVDGEPTAGDGVTAPLTTIERQNGEMQVVANDRPLYHFTQDEEPGDATGQGVNEVWWVLDPSGTPIQSG